MKKLLEQINTKALSLKGASKDYKEEWEATRYLIDSKMFGMLGQEKTGRSILSLKLAPEHGELLRASYPEQVIPGYYMNKVHWNSFFLDNPVDSKMLLDCIEASYKLILAGLSKKRQSEILGL